jgi:thiol:disulfide interchange protein
VPQPARFAVRVADAGRDYRLFVPRAALAGLDHPRAEFFPYNGNAIDQGAAQHTVPGADGLTLIPAKPGGPRIGSVKTLAGVLQLRSGGESRAFLVSAVPAPAPVSAAGPDGLPAWWQAVLLAFLGGLILNLMPCVFPILSLKVLSLATLAHRGDGLRVGLAYGAGVVLSFAVLGGLLLGLREGGVAVGWGFQLQSPVVVGLLAYLLFAMGLSLSGVAEFGIGLTSIGSRLANHAGLAGAFVTGILATVVATQCTAPFMGSALGFAVVAPTPLAFLVFVALGAGLAAPFVVAAAWPGAARVLPRPGPWMVWVKQILAFPLYGTVAWLVWVLAQEVAPGDALMALFGLVAVAFAMWIYGRTRLAPVAGRRWGVGLAALAAIAAVGLAATVSPTASVPVEAASEGLPYKPFTAARFAALRAEKKPVFVNLTAAWCVTCLFNERATLDRPAIAREFAAHGIVALKGDWTRRDPDITAFLQKYGRSGVPLYLLYDGKGSATILPQILTETAVLNAVAKI